jgi:outer membrane protein TolC
MRTRAFALKSCALRVARAAIHLAWASSPTTALAVPSESSPLPVRGDPDVASAPVVSLAEAVTRALSRNPSAVTAEEEIRRADALVEEVRANALPALTGSAIYTRLDGDRVAVLGGTVTVGGQTGEVTLPPSVYEPKGQLGVSAALTVPLIVPRPWAQWSHAADNAEAARAAAADTRRVVAVAVARAYLLIVEQKRVIDVAVRARDTDRAHFDYAHQRFVGGVGNRIDEVRADQQLEADEATLEQDRAGLVRAREALGVLVGVGGPLDAEEPNLTAPTDPQQAMRDAEHRTDVQAADVRRVAADHTVRDDWTDYAPFLSGVFEPVYWNPHSVTQPESGWQAQLILTVPFYDGGLRYGQAKERASLRDEAETNLDATLRQARSDVRTAFEEIRRADRALNASRQAADMARTALELAVTAYRAGATTNIEVIDAERTARDAETAVAVAEDGARQARLDLLSATGRFP